MTPSKDTLVRLDRLESTLVHLTDVIVLQSERMDLGFASLRDELCALRQELCAMREERAGS